MEEILDVRILDSALACLITVSTFLSNAPLSAIQHARNDDSYVLPYPVGSSCKVLQGNNGPYGHKDRNEFAYDFQMSIGSPVVAARSGEVVKVVESNNDSTRVAGQENVVVVKHSDGTFSRYYHLTKNGALVSVGDKVKQGEKIALSGDSGASAGPHLHFDVTKECYEYGCQTVPIKFSNAKENPLKQDETYEALPKAPDIGFMFPPASQA